MRRHEEVEFAVAELKRHDIKYATRDTEGGHVEIAWQVSPDKEVRRVFTSKTPSDHRTRLNARSFIRRALRQDGVAIDPKPVAARKSAALERALQIPRSVPTVPDQIEALRSDLADLIDLMLDIAVKLDADRNPVSGAVVTPSPASDCEAPAASKRKPRRTKAIDFISAGWTSLEAVAKDMDLSPEVAYRKLYYLKNRGLVEFVGGRCRLAPAKPLLPQGDG